MIDEDDCGAIGGMKIGRGNRSTQRKPAPAPFILVIVHSHITELHLKTYCFFYCYVNYTVI
jgi:hypothetical protein